MTGFDEARRAADLRIRQGLSGRLRKKPLPTAAIRSTVPFELLRSRSGEGRIRRRSGPSPNTAKGRYRGDVMLEVLRRCTVSAVTLTEAAVDGMALPEEIVNAPTDSE